VTFNYIDFDNFYFNIIIDIIHQQLLPTGEVTWNQNSNKYFPVKFFANKQAGNLKKSCWGTEINLCCCEVPGHMLRKALPIILKKYFKSSGAEESLRVYLILLTHERRITNNTIIQ
jgi:hypothetical protein